MDEYEARGYIQHDPVRRELERRLAQGQTHGAILWDAYERRLDAIERDIIARRKRHGLRYGLSAFCDSPKHDAVYLLSWASRTRVPDARALLLGSLVVPHMNRCHKRLDLSRLVRRLTEREQVVAAWLAEGKTNQEIAQILQVSLATAKFHVANILTKLEATSRQKAVSILIAERCLS